MDVIPHWFFFVAAGILGLELGGIASIFIQRWIDEVPILKPGRSRCPSCLHKLGLTETIPLVSFLWLKGRCRHCNAAIGAQYLLVELACMAWSIAVAYRFGLSPEWGVYLVLGVMLIVGSLIDIETFLLPDRVTLGGTCLALVASFFLENGVDWQRAFLGAAMGAGLFWVLQQGYRLMRGQEGLGTGDIKLMAMIGAMVGVGGLPLTLFVGSFTGAIASLFYTFSSGKDGIHGKVPYGPFLSLGCMVTVLYGSDIMAWWKV
ncbi:prepilin peptidase [Pseudodesulfovibrio sp. JC047]|uniref:prepilin peptidase n=1 Tax=Pseudodesulfovibrio sp. JC047 TaxID=2683199 RepID=UPI0013CFA028|nr:A24 family peptidase [Pseudodesulfovibrio sp. JC047]NDV19394.1 prepilin peptidase [Pseudodesulfovibrio sp. JC047]